MSNVTWGIARGHGATVFCRRCRHVFGRELSIPDARELLELNFFHKCNEVPQNEKTRSERSE